MKQCQIARGCFLEPHQNLPEAVEPRVGRCHHPSPRLVSRDLFLVVPFLSPGNDVRDIPAGHHGGLCRDTEGSLVRTQVLGGVSRPRCRTIPETRVQDRFPPGHVMSIGSGHDERERDATGVHQEMPLASFFSPDPWGCSRQLLVPVGLLSWPRRSTASPRRSLPSRHIPQVPLSRGSETDPLLPIPGSTGEWRWDFRRPPSARLSTDTPSAAHRQCPRTPGGRPGICVLRRGDGHRSGLPPAVFGESAVSPVPRTGRRLPRTATSPLFSPLKSVFTTCFKPPLRESVPFIYG